jgi:hypothetical protein
MTIDTSSFVQRETENFLKDLELGKISEHELMDMCRKKGQHPLCVEGNFKYYDFIIAETKMAYEVKRDYKSAETGNIVIEVKMYDKPSGLISTRADYWVFDLPDGYLIIKPERIKDCILYHGIQQVKFVGNGDRESKKAYLVKIDILKRNAKRWVSKN